MPKSAVDPATGEIRAESEVLPVARSNPAHGSIEPSLISAVPATQMVAAMEAYQELGRAILNPDEDMVQIGNRMAKTKSAWRKLDAAFNVSNKLLGRDIERDPHTEKIIRATVTSRAEAPNGRFRDGIGVCDVHERCCDPATCRLRTHWEDSGNPTGHEHCEADCPGDVHFSHAEHDIVATAHTRSANRASSDLYGFGEVSAEELQGDGEQRVRRTDEVRQNRGSSSGARSGSSRQSGSGNQQGARKPPPATEGQQGFLKSLLKQRSVASEDVAAYLSLLAGFRVTGWASIDVPTASGIIEKLKNNTAPPYDPETLHSQAQAANLADEGSNGSGGPTGGSRRSTAEPPDNPEFDVEAENNFDPNDGPPEGFSSWAEFDDWAANQDPEYTRSAAGGAGVAVQARRNGVSANISVRSNRVLPSTFLREDPTRPFDSPGDANASSPGRTATEGYNRQMDDMRDVTPRELNALLREQGLSTAGELHERKERLAWHLAEANVGR